MPAASVPSAMRGTSGTPRHTKLARYRCSLPGLAGFAGNRCTEPEVPPNGGPRGKFFLWHDRFAESSTAPSRAKGEDRHVKLVQMRTHVAKETSREHAARRNSRQVVSLLRRVEMHDGIAPAHSGSEVDVDSKLSQETASINSYRVEVSGWDTSDAFFVEKTTLDWSGGDQKEINLASALHEDAVVFVRLLQQVGKVDSIPIAYRASGVKTGENGRTIVQLARLEPRTPFKETTGTSGESQSKVA